MNGDRADADRLATLIKDISKGRADALAELYDRTSPVLFGLLLRMLRQREAAEEALQDCYLQVWKRSERYSPDRGSVIGWLIGIARYRALDRLQALRDPLRMPSAQLDDQLADRETAGLDPEEAAVASEGLERLQRCLADLHEDQRRSVLMAYYEGYSHAELAQAMQAPLGTVKAWVRRGLAKLRACLELP